MTTYSIRNQKWSEDYPYDDGYAIIDPNGVQIGWAKLKDRATDLAREHDEQENRTATGGEGQAGTANHPTTDDGPEPRLSGEARVDPAVYDAVSNRADFPASAGR
jgi:hypothetical protein